MEIMSLSKPISYMAVPGIVRQKPSVQIIIYTICKHHKIFPALLKKKTKNRKIVVPRQRIHYFIRYFYPKIEYPKMTLYKIGELAGNMDHATVLHSIRTVSNLIDTDIKYREEMQKIELLFYSSTIKGYQT